MHILYFHQHFTTPRGSVGIRSYEMARRLIARGHRVTMVCGSYSLANTGLAEPFVRGRRRGMVDGIEVIEFDLHYSNADGFVARTMLFLRYAWGGIRVAMTERYDLVFATSTPLTAGIPAIFARLLRRKPFVFEVRDLWPELPREMGVIKNPLVLGAMSALEWLSYHVADRCVALSPGIARGIARRGIPAERITTIPNGCDLELFGDTAARWRPVGVAGTDLLAIFTGAHGMANGLDAVLDAAAVLKARGRADIKIALVGEGKLKGALKDRADREQLGNVLFLDALPKAQLAGLMAGSDVGMQILANVPAFYYGTSPNKFFDYIAAGLPVLNNYPGWLAEMIAADDIGFVVPPDDPAAFADALVLAADRRADLKPKGKRGLQLAERQFDRRKLADQWVDWVAEGKAA